MTIKNIKSVLFIGKYAYTKSYDKVIAALGTEDAKFHEVLERGKNEEKIHFVNSKDILKDSILLWENDIIEFHTKGKDTYVIIVNKSKTIFTVLKVINFYTSKEVA